MQLETKKLEVIFFRYIMGICAFAMLAALGVYAYLGTFSRYLSDDYCEAVFVKRSSPVGAVIERYSAGDWRAANRYSNLLFVGFGELLGLNNMPITMASMVILWAIGLGWSVHETRKLLRVDWSVQTDCFLGFTLGFFVLLQAPNLFQTIYWRSSMMTHFAPLVLGSFVFAFWMKQAALALENRLIVSPFAVYLAVFFSTFIVAGFSEPSVATMVTALGLAISLTWLFGKSPIKEGPLALLACAFAGAFSGLLLMVFSPASANIVRDSTPGVVEILKDSFLFSYIFIIFSIEMYPLPTLLSAAIPFVLVWLHVQFGVSSLLHDRKRFVWILILVIPMFMWILIAAGFSPSVYGQGFPVERMRFMARALMTAALMLEGTLFALLLQGLRFKQSFVVPVMMAFFTFVGLVYPLRAALNIYADKVPEYRSRAELWDLRNEYIIRQAGLGKREIVVPGFSGVYNIKELDDSQSHWVNVCAAQYYGVDSIRGVPVPDEYLLEYLSE